MQSEKGDKGDKPKKKRQKTEGGAKDKEGGKKGKGKDKGGIATNRPRRQPGAGEEEEGQAAPRRPPRTGAPGEEDEERSEDMNAGEADQAFIDDEGGFVKGVCGDKGRRGRIEAGLLVVKVGGCVNGLGAGPAVLVRWCGSRHRLHMVSYLCR